MAGALIMPIYQPGNSVWQQYEIWARAQIEPKSLGTIPDSIVSRFGKKAVADYMSENNYISKVDNRFATDVTSDFDCTCICNICGLTAPSHGLSLSLLFCVV